MLNRHHDSTRRFSSQIKIGEFIVVTCPNGDEILIERVRLPHQNCAGVRLTLPGSYHAARRKAARSSDHYDPKPETP